MPVGGGGLHVHGSPEELEELTEEELVEPAADELVDDAEDAEADDALDELVTAIPPDDDATLEDELALTELSEPALASEDDIAADEEVGALADTGAERIDPPSPWLIGAGPKMSSPTMPPQLETQMAHKAIACFMRAVLPDPVDLRHGSSLTPALPTTIGPVYMWGGGLPWRTRHATMCGCEYDISDRRSRRAPKTRVSSVFAL